MLFERGRIAVAVADFEATPDRSQPQDPAVQAGLAIARFRFGDSKEDRKSLAAMETPFNERYVPATRLASVHAAMGDREQALARIEKGHEQRAFSTLLLKADPARGGLRADPRFRALLDRVGIDPEYQPLSLGGFRSNRPDRSASATIGEALWAGWGPGRSPPNLMRSCWPIILALLTACSSHVQETEHGRKVYFEAVVREVAGPDARDCGTTGPRFPSSAVRDCAATQLTRRDPFFAIRYEQSVGSDTGTGWVLDGAGRLFLVSLDDPGCRSVPCGVTLSECGKLEMLQDWEWFRAGSCEGRTLPQVFDSSGTSRQPVAPR